MSRLSAQVTKCIDCHDTISPREVQRPEILPLMNPHEPNVFSVIDRVRTKNANVRHGYSG